MISNKKLNVEDINEKDPKNIFSINLAFFLKANKIHSSHDIKSKYKIRSWKMLQSKKHERKINIEKNKNKKTFLFGFRNPNYEYGNEIKSHYPKCNFIDINHWFYEIQRYFDDRNAF